MICPNCKAGADLAATLPAKRNGADRQQTNRYNGIVRRIRNAHRRCKGCTCQHRFIPEKADRAAPTAR